MNLATVDKIARAVLYEGYMLYPYRPSSVKNQQRWNFGVLCPRAYSEAQNGTEAWSMQTECLVQGDALTGLEVRVRFLQLVNRTVGKLSKSSSELPLEGPPEFYSVESLLVNGHLYQRWQEAIEREVVVAACNVKALAQRPMRQEFSFPAEERVDPLREPDAAIAGILLRKTDVLSGEVEISAVAKNDNMFLVRVVVRNTTDFESGRQASRDEALLSALISTHTILGMLDGSFVSLLAPSEETTVFAADCKNIGTWPVLVGEEGQHDTLLSSPIILYDYPQIAPESAGDLFDGTEIDEILSLRIMTLTDEEKREMSQSDERAREMLERTESMPAEQFMKLHGVLRGMRPLKEAR
ncbi:MAG TPA: hypothetical protein VHW45_10295 [Candidatus Sulfotelmatobacter sp.]|nr:hypothetical protein [Candidatus Sulfotelmatobacter sp.]